ncbi:MAG TPA: hypothetical protein VHY20_16150, partial [Pirellulales bacterium]|nr:hypothetical protein [Pirellulales bacterium]
LQEIEGELDPFRGQPPEERQWASPQHRANCAQVIDRSQALLRDIVSQEKESEHLLSCRRDEAAVRLEQAHAASQARGAYGAPHVRPLGHLDLSSEIS